MVQDRDIVTTVYRRKVINDLLMILPFVNVGYLRQWRLQAVDVVGGVTFVTHELLVRLTLITTDGARAVLTEPVRIIKAMITLCLVLP